MTGVSISGITETVFDYFMDCFFDFCVVLAILHKIRLDDFLASKNNNLYLYPT